MKAALTKLNIQGVHNVYAQLKHIITKANE